MHELRRREFLALVGALAVPLPRMVYVDTETLFPFQREIITRCLGQDYRRFEIPLGIGKSSSQLACIHNRNLGRGVHPLCATHTGSLHR